MPLPWAGDTTAPSTASEMEILATPSRVYIGGFFSIMDGYIRRHLVALSANNYSVIEGQVFQDDNGNGVKDGQENGRPNTLVNIMPGNNYFSTDSAGRYKLFVVPGTYTVAPVNPPYTTSVSPTDRTVNFTSISQADTANDFALQVVPDIPDLQVDITNLGAARPGFRADYCVTYRNIGTKVLNGSITLVHDTNLVFQSSMPPQVSYTGNVLAWSYFNLIPGEQRNVTVEYSLPPDINLMGDTLVIAAYGDSIAIDWVASDNYDTLMQVVTAAYDPNDKRVVPQGIGPQGWISNNADSLIYTVRFQNTGNDTAFTVVIRDSLDTALDLSTFTMVSASNNYTVSIHDHVATWTFNQILLPDSNTNEPASHGFLKYKAKLLTGLSEETVIKNTAYIYFDFNPPVITNTVVNTLFDCAGLSSFALSDSVLCIGDSISANYNGLIPGQYLWTFNGDTVGSFQGINFVPSSPGSSQLQLTVSVSSCVSQSVSSLLVNASPQAIVIITGDSLLTSVSQYGNQWYLNGNPIPGATSQNYTVTQNGAYSVQVTDTNGCSAISSPVTITDLAVKDITTSSEVKIYPNPFTNTTTIEISNTANCTCEFTLYDQLGMVVEKLSNIKGERTGLSRKNMKSGMYYYVLRDKDGEVIGKGKVVVQ